MTSLFETLDAHPLTAILLIALVICTGLVASLIVVFGRKIDAKVGRVHVQVHPNGGSSLADAVIAIRADVAAHGVTLAEQDDAIDRVERGNVKISKDQGELNSRVEVLEEAARIAAEAATVAAAIVDRRDPELQRRETDQPSP